MFSTILPNAAVVVSHCQFSMPPLPIANVAQLTNIPVVTGAFFPYLSALCCDGHMKTG